MAVKSGQPNTKQYRSRLGEILATIVNCNVAKAPLTGMPNAPYWIIGRPNIRTSKVNMQEYYWNYTVRFFLARAVSSNPLSIGLADLIDDDIDDVTLYFQDRAHFISTTFATDQAGYIPSSMQLLINGTDSYPLAINVNALGSSYDLSWSHQVIYTPDFN